MRIGSLIRQRRQELGLSQSQLANMLGCRGHWISQLENGRVNFPVKRWEKYADVLRIDKTAFLSIVLKNAIPGIASYHLIRFEDE